MVDVKIWHDIYKSLPDDGERVITEYLGCEVSAIWNRRYARFEFPDPWCNGLRTIDIDPFTSGNCRYWRREIFSSFNGNIIKEGDNAMSKKTMSFIRQIILTILGIALGGVIFGLPGALIVGLILVVKKWPK